jgi:hypothetical protein
MNMNKFLRIVPYVVVVGVVYAAAFLTFEHLFEATHGGSYFQNVVVVLLGTVLTVVVTAILLSEQSRGEENKERHVAVFSKMVTRYERMIQLLVRAEERGGMDADEQCKLHQALYDMSLFCSPSTLSTTTRFLQALEGPGEGGGRVSLFEVVACFRDDMGLPLAPKSAAQLATVEQAILARRRA